MKSALNGRLGNGQTVNIQDALDGIQQSKREKSHVNSPTIPSLINVMKMRNQLNDKSVTMNYVRVCGG